MKIDKELLLEFLVNPTEDIKAEHLSEVSKVVTVIFTKWWCNYMFMFDEVNSAVIATLLERRVRFNPMYDAYNYVFTISRNEVGNIIKREQKQSTSISPEHLENHYELSEDNEPLINQLDFKIPQEVEPYIVYLTGEKDFDYIHISRKSTLPTLLFLAKLANLKTEEVNPSDSKYYMYILNSLLD